jgi:formylglycine-generating enzyme required for sulfatase activity
MGLFDFLFESEESKAAKLRQQELARQEQERARQEKESHVRVDWFKQQARSEKVSIAKDTSIEMCYVPPGQFKMGGSIDVELSAGFWLGRVPITQAVWKAVTGQSPSHFEGNPDLPVESVNWDDCASFIGLLEKNVTLDGRKYRFDFPTEAQWEYACRAGTLGKYAVDRFWHSQKHPMPVGQLPGNALGLQDMHGNVWEWCLDCHQERLPGGIDPCVLPPPPPTPPAIRPRDWTPPPPPSVSRVNRGGSWHLDAAYCCSSNRRRSSPDLRNYYFGFRLALVPSQ